MNGEEKGFGYDFLIDVATLNVPKAKADIQQLLGWMQGEAKKTKAYSVAENFFSARMKGDPLYGAVKSRLTPADISSRISGLQNLNPEEMSKRRQKEVAKEIKGLYELRRNLVNYYDASERGHKKMFLATHQITDLFRKKGQVITNAYKQGSNAIQPLLGFMGKMLGVLGVAIGLWGLFSLAVGLVKRGIGAVKDLFTESLETGKEMEKMSYQLRPFFGSRENAIKAFEHAAKAMPQFDIKETVQGMKTLGEVGVDLTKHEKSIADMAAYAGKSVAETSADIAATINGDLTGLKDYGIMYLQQFRHLAGYPQLMQKAVIDYLDKVKGRYKGMADEFATSWEGMTNRAKNIWHKFKLDIIGDPNDPNSLYGWVKKTFKNVLDLLDKNKDKIEAIAKGIGRLFRTVAQFVQETFSGIFTNFDKLTGQGISEWFMRQEVKLGHFLNTFRMWLVEKFGDGQLWEKIKSGIKMVGDAVYYLSKGVVKTAQALKLAYELVNPMSWGAERWKNLSKDWNDLMDNDDDKKKSSTDLASKGSSHKGGYTNAEIIRMVNDKANKGLISGQDGWTKEYNRLQRLVGVNSQKKEEVKIEKGSEVTIGGKTQTTLEDMKKALELSNANWLLQMINQKVHNDGLKAQLIKSAYAGKGLDVLRTLNNMK